MDIPVNMVGITATLSITMGQLTRTYTTTITVQTANATEIQVAVDMAWQATHQEYNRAVSAVPAEQ